MGPEATGFVEFRDIIFFEDGLPPPTLNRLRLPQDDVDEPVIRPVIRPVHDNTNKLPTPQHASAPPQPLATLHTARNTRRHTGGSTLPKDNDPFTRLPGRHMKRPGAHPTTARELRDGYTTMIPARMRVLTLLRDPDTTSQRDRRDLVLRPDFTDSVCCCALSL